MVPRKPREASSKSLVSENGSALSIAAFCAMTEGEASFGDSFDLSGTVASVMLCSYAEINLGKRHVARPRCARASEPATDRRRRIGNALIVRRRPAVAIGPTGVPRQRNRRFDANLMPRRGAKFEHLQPVAEQVDVVDGLRALVAAIDDARDERVDAVLSADRDIFRPQRDPHLFAQGERMQQ